MNTDRPIQQAVIQRTRLKRTAKIAVICMIVSGMLFWLIAWISPAVRRSEIRTAIVERGNIEATLNATGTVVPQFEQVISSPIDARILRILKKAGDTLHPNEPILLLDLETAMLAYQKVTDQLALKVNEQYQLKASLENQLIKLNSQIKIKQLELQSKKQKLGQNKPLYESTFISKSEFDQIVLDVESAQTQLQELIDTRKNIVATTQLQQEGLELEVKIYRLLMK